MKDLDVFANPDTFRGGHARYSSFGIPRTDRIASRALRCNEYRRATQKRLVPVLTFRAALDSPVSECFTAQVGGFLGSRAHCRRYAVRTGCRSMGDSPASQHNYRRPHGCLTPTAPASWRLTSRLPESMLMSISFT